MATELKESDEVWKELGSAGDELVDASGDGGVQLRRLRAPEKAATKHGSAATPFVEVHYEGFLAANGELFDSSRESGYPMVVQLGAGKVISGWELALQYIRVGETMEVIIRSDYAYGKEESEDIPAGSTLRFVIEVLDARQTPKPVEEIGNDSDAERLQQIRREREEAAKRREEAKLAAEEKKKAAAEAAAKKLASKGQKGGKGKKKK